MIDILSEVTSLLRTKGHVYGRIELNYLLHLGWHFPINMAFV